MHWKKIAKLISMYGAWTANSASFHGTYEPKVPMSLQKREKRQYMNNN